MLLWPLPCIICSHCLYFLRQFKVIAISQPPPEGLSSKIFPAMLLSPQALAQIHHSFKFKLYLCSVEHMVFNGLSVFSISLFFSFEPCISSTRPQGPTKSDDHSCFYLELAPPVLPSAFSFPWGYENIEA